MGKRGKSPGFKNVFCPNKECDDFGRTEAGNIVSNGTYRTQNGKARKFICRTCSKVFNDRAGTFFFDLRTPEDKVLLAIKLLLLGLSVRGVAEALESKPDTVLAWLRRAAQHSDRVNEALMKELKVSKVELDELWTFVEKKQLRAWTKKRANIGSG